MTKFLISFSFVVQIYFLRHRLVISSPRCPLSPLCAATSNTCTSLDSDDRTNLPFVSRQSRRRRFFFFFFVLRHSLSLCTKTVIFLIKLGTHKYYYVKNTFIFFFSKKLYENMPLDLSFSLFSKKKVWWKPERSTDAPGHTTIYTFLCFSLSRLLHNTRTLLKIQIAYKSSCIRSLLLDLS